MGLRSRKLPSLTSTHQSQHLAYSLFETMASRRPGFPSASRPSHPSRPLSHSQRPSLSHSTTPFSTPTTTTATKITKRPSSHPNSTPTPTATNPPTTTPTTTTPTSKADLALTAQTSLTTLTSALHLLERAHHRNKNQHRLSGWWWARADMLRRGVRKLVGGLEGLVGDGGGESGKKITSGKGRGRVKGVAGGERGVLEKVERRAVFLRWSLGPRAFVAFTQLAADKNFAQLGLMLLGVLAQIDQALAPFAPALVNSAVEDVGQEAVVMSGELPGTSAPNDDTEMANDIMGVAVSREEVMASIEGDDSAPQTSASTPLPHSQEREPETRPRTISIPTHTVSSKRQLTSQSRLERQSKEDSTNPDEPAQLKKKKKKIKSGGDEFDDIFGASEPVSKPKKKRPKLEGSLEVGSITDTDNCTDTRTNKTNSAVSPAPAPVPPMTSNPDEPPRKKKVSSKARVPSDEFDGIFGSLDDNNSGGDAEENTKKKSDRKKKEKVKKKRKRGDEFDDIFQGF
ncbi:hypothetical protein B0J18DRAFT_428531 [Chaetomium sp. MPI-SDFR-AT-0129]|nr:hypothetical protein B0J18DRAFT_428531 [Chaetomium sp. MPI-SDFR-AT-0129]